MAVLLFLARPDRFDLEDPVIRVWMFVCMMVVACSTTELDTASQPAANTTLERELIPAEWTVAEDTSGAGEITTTSVQLPAARDIAGLLQEEAPRLVLRCLEGRVAVFIDTDLPGGTAPDSRARAQPVRIDLDAAPRCE